MFHWTDRITVETVIRLTISSVRNRVVYLILIDISVENKLSSLFYVTRCLTGFLILNKKKKIKINFEHYNTFAYRVRTWKAYTHNNIQVCVCVCELWCSLARRKRYTLFQNVNSNVSQPIRNTYYLPYSLISRLLLSRLARFPSYSRYTRTVWQK